MRLQSYLLFLLVLTQFGSSAQEGNYFRFQKIEGLSQNTAFSITQDKQGFLWIGTGDGLNRFDGAVFKAYKPSSLNLEGFITGRVIRTRITEDNNNRLWLSTEAGVQYLDKKSGRFQYLLPFNDTFSYMNGTLYPIAEEGTKFWFGKTSEGLISFDFKTKQYEKYAFPGLKDNPLKYLATKAVKDSNGIIWTCQEAGLFAFNSRTGQWTRFLENRKLYHLCLVKETLFLVAADGILSFHTKNYTTGFIKNERPEMKISCITSDHQNQLWIGDAAGSVYKVNIDEKKMQFTGNINGNSGNIFPVYDLFFDASGILWIGTDGMGLLKANVQPPDFFQFPGRASSEHIFIKSIYEASDGSVWLGTFGHGILQLNKSSMTMKPLQVAGLVYDEAAPIDVVTFMKEDEFKNLWIGYGKHLFFRKHPSAFFKEVAIPYSGSRDKLKVTGMDTCNGSRIITTTFSVYNMKVSESGEPLSITSEPELGNFSFMLSRGNGDYLFGYNETGLCLNTYQNNKWAINKWLFKKTGFKCVYKDTVRKLLWFGTDKGLMLYNPENGAYRLFTEEDGLGNSFIYSIIESGGELWLSTNGGLCNVKILPAKGNEFPGIICRNYKYKDGLQADEFNSGAYLKGKTGTLYFGGINGLTWFNPQDIKPPRKIPQLAITQLTVNNAVADTSVSPEYIRNLDLGYRQNNLFIQFRGLEYSNPTEIQYAYMLTGWDKDWIFSKTNNEVRYNNLPPGEYVFNVKATNVEGQWQNDPYSITIVIHPPFWKTWWFYLLELVLVSALVITITKVIAQRKLKKKIDKLERQKELYAERMRISQEMHDDIGAGLTQISLISESARLHAVPGNNIRSELEDISTTSRQLVDNIGEIIWALNPYQDKLDATMIHLREQINKLIAYSTIHCIIRFPEEFPDISLNNQLRRNILLVTKEIVHNVIKHSGAVHLSIEAVVQKSELHFIIADDGIGFDTTTAAKGNGLRNIRQRIMESGGNIEVHSSSGKGTRYAFYFPLK